MPAKILVWVSRTMQVNVVTAAGKENCKGLCVHGLLILQLHHFQWTSDVEAITLHENKHVITKTKTKQQQFSPLHWMHTEERPIAAFIYTPLHPDYLNNYSHTG